MKRHFINQYRIGIVGGLVGLLCLSVLRFSGDGVHAETTSANASVTVAEACTMTATVNSAHSATINPGQYLQPIGETVLKVICNDAGGYAIYAVGNANNEYGNNKLLANVGGSLNSTYDIVTGTATSGSTSNWAMKVSAVSGIYAPTIQNSFGSYHDVPTTYTKVAQLNSMTDATTGSSVSTTYAAYVKSDQPAGSYNGKVKYTMVHPTTEAPLQPQVTQSGQICYYPNGSNVEGTMGCQTIGTVDTSNSSTSAILLASNYSREGYGFAGWSKTFDYSDDTGFLGPQEYIEFPAGTYTGNNDGLSLYAHWIKSAGSLQGWTCPNNTTMPVGAVTALTDQRDDETYAVAKLADGNCWMIENMRLENIGTDNTNGSLAQGYNASFAGLADPEASWANNSTTANSLYSTNGSTDKTISGSNQGYRFPRYNNVNTPTTATDRPSNPTSNSATNSTTNASMYSYGNYYTWAAAIADTTNYTTNNQSVTNASICPTGWHLPKGGNKSNEANNEFWSLIVTGINNGTNPANYDSSTTPNYTGTPEGSDASNALRAYPNNFVYSGSAYGGSVGSRGDRGFYWSSTASSSNFAYRLLLFSYQVYPGTNGYDKYGGWAVRCVVTGA